MSMEKIKKIRELTGAGIVNVKKALVEVNWDEEKAIEWLRKNGIAKAAKKANQEANEGVVSISKKDNKISIIKLACQTDFVSSNGVFQELAKEISDIILENGNEGNSLEDYLKLNVGELDLNSYLLQKTTVIGEKVELKNAKLLTLKENEISATYVHSNKRIGVVVIAEDVEEITLKDIAMHIAAMNPSFLSVDEVDKDWVEKEKLILKEQLKNDETNKNKSEEILERILSGQINKIVSENVLLNHKFVKDPSKKISDILGKGRLISFIRFEIGD